jgi:hypothetical protein
MLHANVNKAASVLALPLLGLAIAGCGGGGGGGGGGSIAGGGIGGTGIGTITGFGSVIINDTRTFGITGETGLFIDGVAVSEPELEQTGEGLVTRVIVSDDVSADFTSGTALTVEAENIVKGPVTGISPLQVLEQTVVVNGDTLLVDMAGDIGNVNIGDIVEVSGYADSANVIQATRVQRKAGGTLVWKLTGPASAVVANTSFEIGNQRVVLNGVVPRDCNGGLASGDLVEVKADPIPGFVSGDDLDSTWDVECETPGLSIPDGSGDSLEAEVEGLVTFITSASDFRVNGQRVVTNAATQFEGGGPQDIVLGVKLEAEGRLDTATGILTAEEIEFRETRFRIEGPVQPGDVDTDQDTLVILGITVSGNSLTEDEDGIFTAGLPGNTQVEVNGYVDSSGNAIATELRDRGAADPGDVRLRGPAENLLPLSSFDILGVTVDVDSAVSIQDERVEPPQVLDAVQFFNAIGNGTPVQVQGGTYNPGPNTITGGEIEIED